MPSTPMVESVWIPVLIDIIRAAGWPSEQVLRAVGLRRDQLDSRRRVSLRKFLDLVDLAAEVVGDPAFGLHLGEQRALVTMGHLGYIVRNSPTVGTAFANGRRYLRLHADAVEIDLDLTGPHARLSLAVADPSIRMSRHYVEFAMVYCVKLLRLGGGDGWAPEAVGFRHRAPEDRSPHRRVFGAPVRFDQDASAMVFDRAVLSRPVAGADARLLRILEDHAEQVLAELPAPDDLIERLHRYVVEALPASDAGVDGAARALGMSVRTLQRRLRERDTVFARLVDEVRRRLSIEYLANDELSLAEIAYLLGYSETSAFHRAYRRWTGRAPAADRRRATAA